MKQFAKQFSKILIGVMTVKQGDKVKHNNMHIEGEIVQVDKAEKGEKPVIHVQCEGGTYYDTIDQWQPAKK